MASICYIENHFYYQQFVIAFLVILKWHPSLKIKSDYNWKSHPDSDKCVRLLCKSDFFHCPTDQIVFINQIKTFRIME
jgi:hypothetical protein